LARKPWLTEHLRFGKNHMNRSDWFHFLVKNPKNIIHYSFGSFQNISMKGNHFFEFSFRQFIPRLLRYMNWNFTEGGSIVLFFGSLLLYNNESRIQLSNEVFLITLFISIVFQFNSTDNGRENHEEKSHRGLNPLWETPAGYRRILTPKGSWWSTVSCGLHDRILQFIKEMHCLPIVNKSTKNFKKLSTLNPIPGELKHPRWRSKRWSSPKN